MTCGTDVKNKALYAIAQALSENKAKIIEANAVDMAKAKESGKSASRDGPVMLDARARSTPLRRKRPRQVAALEDSVGKVDKMTTRPNGLIIGRRRVPLGVIAIVYESQTQRYGRRGVLCLKAGNAVILRGGKEAFTSNNALTELMRNALERGRTAGDAVSLVQDTTHESVDALLNLSGYIDVLIPRGGAGLIRRVVRKREGARY
jgi:glutamate-5-semialdehyde dehydrogenase